jgi:hypothetical protein
MKEQKPIKTELAWAAGLFDGEGSIGVYKNATSSFLLARINMCHKEAINHFHDIVTVGTGQLYTPKQKNRRPYWKWRANGEEAAKVLKLLYPFLLVKSRQANLVLDWPNVDKAYVEWALKQEKKR